MPRFEKLIHACRTCPHYRGGECREVSQVVEDNTKVAPFCPLPFYPDQQIADLARTLKIERNPRPYGLAYMVTAHVACKFDLLMEARGVTFKLKDGSTIPLQFDYITKIRLHGPEILFMVGDKAYRVTPDTQQPTLYAAVQVPNKAEMGWTRLELAR